MRKQAENIRMAGLVIGFLCMIGISCASYCMMRNSFMTMQQNMIGKLYGRDPRLCEEMALYLFEDHIFWETSKEGEAAMVAMGYTKRGFFYLFQNSGWTQIYIWGIVLQVLVALLVLAQLLWMRKEKRGEEAALALDISRATVQGGRLEEGKYRFLGNAVAAEISHALEMLQAKEKYLLEKNRQTQDFIENIAHQIKTPLSCISISLDLMLEEAKGKQREALTECFRYLDSIETLMKRLLSIGRMEAGKIIMHKEAIQIGQLLEDCKSTLPGGEERVWIGTDSLYSDTDVYYGDYEWLKEAFLNIIKNCMEHDTGSEKIRVWFSKTAEGNKITIRDHGAGILEQDLPFIFDRFYLPEREKKSHSGIGLNLARLIIERHFGTIKAGNHEEGGAVFTIILPVFALKDEKF